MRSYTDAVRRVPQSEAIPGAVANSAGGFSFAVDDWTRLDRFLILGSEGGSYYASEGKLTRENAACVERCLRIDGARTVGRIAEVSEAGRAPRNTPAIFALAMALKLGDVPTKRYAGTMVPKVCRIGTHLFQLAEAVQAFGGWGRGTKRAFANWYLDADADALAHNLVKYQSRDGWSHRDILRLAHPEPQNEAQVLSLGWATGHDVQVALDARRMPAIIYAFEEAKKATDARQVVRLIENHGLPRECVPTQFLNDVAVWEALLMSGKGMPFTAMIRNLAKMTSIGLLKPLSRASDFVARRLADVEGLKRARVHPMQILLALSVYAAGRGEKGKLSWDPASTVVDALDEGFYNAFAAVEPTGKRHLLALDVSGSMRSPLGGTSLSCAEASTAMALVTARTEKQHHIVAFTSGHPGEWGGAPSSFAGYRSSISPFGISPRMRLDSAVKAAARLPMGGTDCAQPMLYAMASKLEVDVFTIYTDSETWAGRIHPVQALKEYRQKMGIAAKLIVVGMTSNGFSIADPSDGGMLDVVGFDASAPAVMADFARG